MNAPRPLTVPQGIEDPNAYQALRDIRNLLNEQTEWNREYTVTVALGVGGPATSIQGIPIDPNPPTLIGQTIYFDGTKWVSGSNNVPYWRVQVANAHTVGLWQFDPNLGVGGLGDSGPNGLTLTAVGSSVARYIEGAPGISGIILDSLGQFEHANHASLNALTDAITISGVATLMELPAAGSVYRYFVTYDGAAETQNTNYLFSAGVVSFASQAGAQMDAFWEHGAGGDVDVKSVSSAPVWRPFFFCYRRTAASGGVCSQKFDLNGINIKTVTGLTPADTGASPAQVLTIGGDATRPTPTSQARAVLSSLHIENVALSDADVLTRYNYVCRGIG